PYIYGSIIQIDVRVNSLRAAREAAMYDPTGNSIMSELTSALDTAGEAAYRQIRHDIIFGGLAPGVRLRLERLRETYRASVSTLRETLNRLASERLVLAEGQRGFAVAPVSQQHFRDVAAMRELLE